MAARIIKNHFATCLNEYMYERCDELISLLSNCVFLGQGEERESRYGIGDENKRQRRVLSD